MQQKVANVFFNAHLTVFTILVSKYVQNDCTQVWWWLRLSEKIVQNIEKCGY